MKRMTQQQSNSQREMTDSKKEQDELKWQRDVAMQNLLLKGKDKDNNRELRNDAGVIIE